jgi:cytochrome bd-type quinol oxidase subunit 1
MKRLFENTGKLLLSAATLVIVLHLLIPHDHHQESLCFHTPYNMPAHEHHTDNPAFPAHCHAFNDLDAQDKNVNFSRIVSLVSIPVIFNEESSSENNFLNIVVVWQKTPHELSGTCNSSRPFRAPPVIS